MAGLQIGRLQIAGLEIKAGTRLTFKTMKLKPGTSSKSTDKRPFKTFRKRFTDTAVLNGEHDRDWRPFFVARNEAVDTNHVDVDVKDVFCVKL